MPQSTIRNCYIRVKDAKESAKIQRALFDGDCWWWSATGPNRTVQNLHAKVIMVDVNGRMMTGEVPLQEYVEFTLMNDEWVLIDSRANETVEFEGYIYNRMRFESAIAKLHRKKKEINADSV